MPLFDWRWRFKIWLNNHKPIFRVTHNAKLREQAEYFRKCERRAVDDERARLDGFTRELAKVRMKAYRKHGRPHEFELAAHIQISDMIFQFTENRDVLYQHLAQEIERQIITELRTLDFSKALSYAKNRNDGGTFPPPGL
jgi:hypothetical protein